LFTVTIEANGCRTSHDYLIDASTGEVVGFDSAPRKAG
jgi:predicted small secreted protein